MVEITLEQIIYVCGLLLGGNVYQYLAGQKDKKAWMRDLRRGRRNSESTQSDINNRLTELEEAVARDDEDEE